MHAKLNARSCVPVAMSEAAILTPTTNKTYGIPPLYLHSKIVIHPQHFSDLQRIVAHWETHRDEYAQYIETPTHLDYHPAFLNQPTERFYTKAINGLRRRTTMQAPLHAQVKGTQHYFVPKYPEETILTLEIHHAPKLADITRRDELVGEVFKLSNLIAYLQRDTLTIASGLEKSSAVKLFPKDIPPLQIKLLKHLSPY